MYKFDDVINYNEFKMWFVRTMFEFMGQKIPRLYIKDSPKQTLNEWMREFLEYCEYK